MAKFRLHTRGMKYALLFEKPDFGDLKKHFQTFSVCDAQFVASKTPKQLACKLSKHKRCFARRTSSWTKYKILKPEFQPPRIRDAYVHFRIPSLRWKNLRTLFIRTCIKRKSYQQDISKPALWRLVKLIVTRDFLPLIPLYLLSTVATKVRTIPTRKNKQFSSFVPGWLRSAPSRCSTRTRSFLVKFAVTSGQIWVHLGLQWSSFALLATRVGLWLLRFWGCTSVLSSKAVLRRPRFLHAFATHTLSQGHLHCFTTSGSGTGHNRV